MQVAIDRAECIGSAQCVVIAPRAFRLDDSMKAEVIDSTAEALEDLIEAAFVCPTQAIYISQGSTSIFP